MPSSSKYSIVEGSILQSSALRRVFHGNAHFIACHVSVLNTLIIVIGEVVRSVFSKPQWREHTCKVNTTKSDMAMTCATCDMPIEGKSITALGKNYHPDHFVCGVCRKPIVNETFHQKDGMPLCNKDYEATCPKCAQCEKPITDKVIKAMGKEWHENHFTCGMCSCKLIGAEFHENMGKPICKPCFVNKVADKCKACGEPIQTSATIALDAKWHPDCFKCNKCSKAITTTSFKVDQKGYPLCEKC